jgi:anti-sigma factor RsiW
MTDHLTEETLNQFADGELASDQMAEVDAHLAACQACTATALSQMVLKSTAARAGQRYALPDDLRDRLMHQAAAAAPAIETKQASAAHPGVTRRFGWVGWAAAALLLVLSGLVMSNERAARSRSIEAALVAEISDQHISTLASSQEPQVLSSDRHTVKPWFQGKVPFSFNLPDTLPADTKLDGANLAYLHNRPVAQLLYSIGHHRVSVFVRERGEASELRENETEHSGFHVVRADTPELELVAISDVDPARLRDLMAALAQAQTKGH